MSINTAMLAGVSGLKANATAMAAISDNIANVNTIGYKRVQADFQTMVNGQAGRGVYSAGGVIAAPRQFVSQGGVLQRTSSGTDLGITGNGFFVVTTTPENLTISDARSFTRAGAFSVDELGYLRNGAGLYLQGWTADDNGQIHTDPSDLSSMQSLNVAGVGGIAEQTTRVGINANLQSSQPLSAQLATYNAATSNMASYDAVTGAGVKPDFEIQIPVSDSKGGQRTLTMGVLRSGTPNQWLAEIYAVPASDVVSGAGLVSGQLRTGTLTFTQDGRLDLANSTLFGGATTPILTIGASDAAAPGAGQANWAPSLGIAGQPLQLDLGGSASGISQYDSQSVVQSIAANGTPFGNLTSTEIDEQGLVTAVFDNGVTRVVGQVGLATFPNPDGLQSVNGNAYRVSAQSGTYNLKVPGTGGAGTLSPYTLEGSTVDLSQEFTGLITTQRAYSASSKIITTADQMLEELINIKR